MPVSPNQDVKAVKLGFKNYLFVLHETNCVSISIYLLIDFLVQILFFLWKQNSLAENVVLDLNVACKTFKDFTRNEDHQDLKTSTWLLSSLKKFKSLVELKSRKLQIFKCQRKCLYFHQWSLLQVNENVKVYWATWH